MNWNKIQKTYQSWCAWLRHIKKCHTWHIYYFACFLCLFVGSVALTAKSEDTSEGKKNNEVTQLETETPSDDTEEKSDVPESQRKLAEKTKDGNPQPQKADNQTVLPDSVPEGREQEGEEINGSADNLERYEKRGITILTGNVKILRTTGYLHADKVTFHTEPETGKTVLTIAEKNVEIRDEELFATCEHATMNHLTNTIILKEDVVVLQNKDRLETTLFTYNRATGKQFAEGDVKFKVRVTEAEPVVEENAQTEPDEKSNDINKETPASKTDEEDEDGLDKDATRNSKESSSDAATDEKDELPENVDEPKGEENLEDKGEDKEQADAAEEPSENTEEEPRETPENETGQN